MRRTFASLLVVIALIAIPIYMSGQTGAVPVRSRSDSR